MNKLKISFITLSILLFLFASYYIKCRQGINFFTNFSLSAYFPFDFLHKNSKKSLIILKNSESGEILTETFERNLFGIRNWNLWAQDQGEVHHEFNLSGENKSRCLLVKSKSSKNWSCKFDKFIEVNFGEIYKLDGDMEIEGLKCIAGFSVTLYNNKTKAIKWSYAKITSNKTDEWVKLSNEFTIPADVKYIRLNITGSGKGISKFDNITLKKV